MKKIGAGAFKATCLELMDQVRERQVEYVITKRGKPVARLVPVDATAPSPFGFMRGPVIDQQEDGVLALKLRRLQVWAEGRSQIGRHVLG